jgi:hypothetical protein
MGTKVFASAVNFQSVTPSDTTLIVCYGLFVGTGGDIAIATESGSAVLFKNIASGTILPVSLRSGRIMATNTTAADIVALTW